jgi:hypothetical protein
VFDPRHIEDVLDRDLTTVWREEDAMAAKENRRRAAGRAALKRAQEKNLKAAHSTDKRSDDAERHKLEGWDEFLSATASFDRQKPDRASPKVCQEGVCVAEPTRTD